MARILRGEIWWADLNPVRGHEQAGVRPVLVISENEFNRHSGTVIAVAITSQQPKARFPLTLEIRSLKLSKRSWVKIGQVRTLSIDRLSSKMGVISAAEMELVIEGLNEIVGGS